MPHEVRIKSGQMKDCTLLELQSGSNSDAAGAEFGPNITQISIDSYLAEQNKAVCISFQETALRKADFCPN